VRLTRAMVVRDEITSTLDLECALPFAGRPIRSGVFCKRLRYSTYRCNSDWIYQRYHWCSPEDCHVSSYDPYVWHILVADQCTDVEVCCIVRTWFCRPRIMAGICGRADPKPSEHGNPPSATSSLKTCPSRSRVENKMLMFFTFGYWGGVAQPASLFELSTPQSEIGVSNPLCSLTFVTVAVCVQKVSR
jgi:hypothetical protein